MQTFKIETLKSGVAALILTLFVFGLLVLLIALKLPSSGFIIAFCVVGMTAVFILSNFLIKKFAVEKLNLRFESDHIIIDRIQADDSVVQVKIPFSTIRSYNYNQNKGDKSIKLELVEDSPITLSYNSSYCKELDFDSLYDALEKAFSNYNSNLKLPVSQELDQEKESVKMTFRKTDLILDESGTYKFSDPSADKLIIKPILKEKPFYEKKIAGILAAIFIIGLIGFTISLAIYGLKDKYFAIFLVYSSAASYLFPFFLHRSKKN